MVTIRAPTNKFIKYWVLDDSYVYGFCIFMWIYMREMNTFGPNNIGLIVVNRVICYLFCLLFSIRSLCILCARTFSYQRIIKHDGYASECVDLVGLLTPFFRFMYYIKNIFIFNLRVLLHSTSCTLITQLNWKKRENFVH